MFDFTNTGRDNNICILPTQFLSLSTLDVVTHTFNSMQPPQYNKQSKDKDQLVKNTQFHV